MILPTLLPAFVIIVLAAFPASSQAATASRTPRPVVSSVYTSLQPDACTLLDEGDEYVQGPTYACSGIGGYKLRTYDSDLRAELGVVAPDGTEFLLRLPAVVHPGFSTLGTKAEWRVTRQDGKVIPKALIIRYIGDQWSDDGSKNTRIQYLAVAKIAPGGTCVTDRIVQGRQMNLLARKAADASGEKKCLSPEEGSRR